MARYEFLDAVNRRDVTTADQLAAALKEAVRAVEIELRDAELDGLVRRELDVSASLPAPREYLLLTQRGREEWERLDGERSGSSGPSSGAGGRT